MSSCHDISCKEKCRICHMSEGVMAALAEVKQPAGAGEFGDALLVGHIMALLATMQQRGPFGRLHLCMRHREFAIAQGLAMGVVVMVPPHKPDVPINAPAAGGVN